MDVDNIRKEKPIDGLINFGILNIDKPSGPTSFQVSHFIRNLLNVNKTSHGGTLDPLVSGVLPIMLGRACRLSEYIMHRDKTYIGIMRLHSDIDDEELNRAVKKFLGKIKQLPPVRSRVKRAIREREVKTFSILEREGRNILFETQVQAGTYIRKLCDDMGREIGGAHMLELRRSKAGIFNEEKSFTLYELEVAVRNLKNGDETKLREMIIPGEIISSILPVLKIKKEYVKKLYTGSPIFKSFLEEAYHNLETGDRICAISEGRFIGCYNVVNEKGILAKPEFVFN